ncbi:hypothetical protein MPTK2_3g07900 [Marchantia polymorpha subsp. ruderalis]
MECDPWDWQDEGLKLDGGYTLETAKYFWDEMPFDEDVSKTLLSTPIADILSQDPPVYAIRNQDPVAASTPGLSDNVFRGGGLQGACSPRIKRRRLLFREPESAFDSREDSSAGLEFFTDGVPDIQAPLEDQSLQSDAFWYRPCDGSVNAFGDVDVLDGGSHRWMAKCLEEGELSNKMRDDMKIALPGCDSPNAPGHAPREEDVQGPATPLPGRTAHGCKPIEQRNQLSPPCTPSAAKFAAAAAAAAAPVAYPFTLLKPEGGLTLREINEKLMSPPSRPVPHVQAEDAWPTSPGELGLGLSGKSVITRTRIHTMGNGTITIMRTRD